MTLPAALQRCTLRLGAEPEHISDAEAAIGKSFPSDYRSLLEETNGFEGFVDSSEEVFLSFWPVADIPELNRAYSVEEFVPGVVLLGTDGGDTGYGFTTLEGQTRYVSLPLIGMGLEGSEEVGGSFCELLSHLGG